MGEYSIAKSYKGILRIANVMQYNESEPDEFLNPYYYGSPKNLMNISGGSLGSAKEYGYPTPISGMQGTCNRYTPANPFIGEDELKLYRIPLTDSMGNYLNWNIGLDGVTVGSNDAINGNKYTYSYFNQRGKYMIAQETNFPILESNKLILGLANKLTHELKYSVKPAEMHIVSAEYGNGAQLIVENHYDKTAENTKPLYVNTFDDQGNVIDGEYELSDWSYYNTPSKYKKLRTVYNAKKPTVQDYDVFMYRQDDWDYDNFGDNTIKGTITVDQKDYSTYKQHLQNKDGYAEGEFLDCHADLVNLKEYIKIKINDYLNGNVKQVPSGTVIWQYCSPQKWYSRQADPSSTDIKAYPGNRPAMGLRKETSDEKFYNSLIQGACKKISHLLNESEHNSGQQELEESQGDSMGYESGGDFLTEAIPLYKRDYVLCDGSLYRIPYRPQFNNADISTQRQAFDRFINLYFALGYRYTQRNCVADRTDFRIGDDGCAILQGYRTSNSEGSRDITLEIFNDISPTKKSEIYKHVLDTFSSQSWVGNPPKLVNVSIRPDENDPWQNLDDLDVLFGMDLASMISCDILFDEYNSSTPFGAESITQWVDMEPIDRYNKIMEWSSNQENGIFHEKYIFNTLVGDTQAQVNSYWENSPKQNQTTAPQIMNMPYYNFNKIGSSLEIDTTQESIYPQILIGREVNNLRSWIKVYDHNDKKYKIIKVIQLPNVQLFAYLLSTKHRIEDSINKFCYMYFNYNFQVPKMMADDYSPVFIGSSGVRWSDPRNKEMIKVESWSSNFTSSSIPHRHALFCSPIDKFNTDQYQNFSGSDISSGSVSGSSFNGGSLTDNSNREDGKGGYIVNEIIGQWRTLAYSDNSTDSDTGQGTGSGQGSGQGTGDSSSSSSSGNTSAIDDPDTTINSIQNVSGVRVRVIDIPYPNDGVDISFNNLVTGNYRSKIASLKPVQETDTQVEDDSESEETIVGADEYVSWDSVTKQDPETFTKYYEYEKDYWCSFRIQDDPRFDTGEPNRGITSAPIMTQTYSEIPITKRKVNEIHFYLSNGSFFSPENVKMLPLIKI